jgi:hypothetical protein
MSSKAKLVTISGACLAFMFLLTPVVLSQPMVQAEVLSFTTVGFKPGADPDSARHQFQSIGINIPGNKFISRETILSTPDRKSTMRFVEALRQNAIVFDVDYTYSDQYQRQFYEHMQDDTAYLIVRFKTTMTVVAERDWLRQNFPELKDQALDNFDQPYIFFKSIALNKDGSERYTQGAKDNPWYAAMNYTFKTVDVIKSSVPIAKIQSFDCVQSVQTHAQPIFKQAAGPPTYMEVLASQIKRAWFPAHRSTNHEPMTVRLLLTADGEISRLHFVRLASASLCNNAACKAILDAFYQSGIDLLSLPSAVRGAQELEVLFYDGYKRPDPAPKLPVVVRPVDVVDDSEAPGWFTPWDPTGPMPAETATLLQEEAAKH